MKHHKEKVSKWLVRWTRASGKPVVPYDAIVDQLICFGWIDSLPRKLNEHKTMLRISPRDPKSNWSGKNKERVQRMLRQGLMHDSGMQLVEEAKKNGAWNFLDEVEQLIIPPDLKAALEKQEHAARYFEGFPDSSKRSILEWIKNAKQEATRSKRIAETAEKAAKNIKANHPKGREAGPKEE